MNLEFWLSNWQNNKIGFHQPDVNQHLLSFWPSLNIAPERPVFVPLCGKSHDLLWLSQQGHQVLGVEISAIAVATFFSDNALTPVCVAQDTLQSWETARLKILQGDFFDVTVTHVQDIDGVFDRAALIALPAELRQDYALHLKRILPGRAKILLVTFEYDPSKMNGPPFSVTEAEVNMLYQDSYVITLLSTQEVLKNYPAFQAIGLESLYEKVYVLTPHYP